MSDLQQPPLRAYTYQLGKGDMPGGVDQDVVSQSAGWMLLFVPFEIANTFHNFHGSSHTQDAVSVRAPIVVQNDCISLRITQSKNSPFGTLEATLRSGNLDYLSCVMPGDYVFAWMCGQASQLDTVKTQIDARQSANSFHSGFKFLGRVDSARKRLSVSPTTGVKQMLFTVSAFSFQELNTKVYINPFLTLTSQTQFMQQLIPKWEQATKIGLKGVANVQDLVRLFFDLFLGTGPKNKFLQGMLTTPNEAFWVPRIVGQLLGRDVPESRATVLKYTDMMTLLQGIQTYSASSSSNERGFLPYINNLGAPSSSGESSKTKASKHNKKPPPPVRQYTTGVKCSGWHVIFADKWNDTPIWSILQQYLNPLINELYSCFRVDLDGLVVPTIVMRQIPFSTQEYLDTPWGQGGAKGGHQESRAVTLFMTLPRWKAPPSMVLDVDVGRSNSLRVNFVQVWGDLGGIEGEIPQKRLNEMTQGNVVIDSNDIRRSGLRPLIQTSPHDWLGAGTYYSPSWARKLSDWTINGHLKLNGTIALVGVTEPICVGDNFEWDGSVFHIEQVTHTAEIGMSGTKTFRTTLALSNGVDARTGQLVKYSEMDTPYRENLAEKDNIRERVYPGYTDVTDEPGRTDAGRISTDLNQRVTADGKPQSKPTASPARTTSGINIDIEKATGKK